MGLKERIAEAIEASGKRKAEIARQCGVTNAAVTQWLDGTTKSLKADKALALEAATGYRATWMLSGKGARLTTDSQPVVWPFLTVELERFEALAEREKGYVESKLEEAIQRCELQRHANVRAKQVLRSLGAKREAMTDAEVARVLPAAPPLIPGARRVSDLPPAPQSLHASLESAQRDSRERVPASSKKKVR